MLWIVALLVIVAAILIWRAVRAKAFSHSGQKASRSHPSQQAGITNSNPVTIAAHVAVQEKSVGEARATELLKEATERQRNGDFDGAIASLRAAYVLLGKSSTIYPIETYLRLPRYLQKAGHFREAETEFDELLSNTDSRIARQFDHQDLETRKGLAAMERHYIYKAMRTAYQREGKRSYALLYGLLDHANQCVGLRYQKQGNELNTKRDESTWKRLIDELVDNYDVVVDKKAIIKQCTVFSKQCTESRLVQLGNKLRSIITADEARTSPLLIESDAADGPSTSEPDRTAWLNEATRGHLSAARMAWEAGDFATARTSYLKTAQALTQIKDADWAKEKLRQEQIEFANADPLYRKILSTLLPIVRKEPAILQTTLYGRLPFSREDVSYALYFAHELGDIRRRKKGRTYEIFPAGTVIDAPLNPD